MSLTTIIFTRHTDVHNPGDVLYGRLPRFGLSDLGRKQAEATRAVLAAISVDVFYTSPQMRARQTTRLLAASHPGVPVEITGLLAEVRTGWQGRPHADLEEIGFNFYDHRLTPRDETLEQLWDRIQRFTAMARRNHPGKTVVAVTHGDICHLARGVYRGLPLHISSIRLPHPYPGKGSLTRLTFDSDLANTYPVKVEYIDPNGDEPPYNTGWTDMERTGAAA